MTIVCSSRIIPFHRLLGLMHAYENSFVLFDNLDFEYFLEN